MHSLGLSRSQYGGWDWHCGYLFGAHGCQRLTLFVVDGRGALVVRELVVGRVSVVRVSASNQVSAVSAART